MSELEFTEIDFVSYSQPGGVFYACSLPAASIVRRLDIRRRSDDPEFGMQRDDNPVRVREITKYAEEFNAVFPTPLIISTNLDHIKITGKKLSIPNGTSIIGHVLDGQHRLLGLKSLSDIELSRFELLVVFVFEIDVYSEATIFSTINSTQKQVSKSLMYDLFSLYPGRSPEKTSHEIVRSLNDDADSPFFNRIKILGKKMDDIETLSQAAFVDQISRQIKEKGSPLNKFFMDNQDWAIRKIVANCFGAIIFSQSKFGNIDFPKDYFLKTTGFGGVAQSLNEIVSVGIERGSIDRKFFDGIMDNLFENFKSPPQGVGNSAMLKVKEAIIQAVH